MRNLVLITTLCVFALTSCTQIKKTVSKFYLETGSASVAKIETDTAYDNMGIYSLLELNEKYPSKKDFYTDKVHITPIVKIVSSGSFKTDSIIFLKEKTCFDKFSKDTMAMPSIVIINNRLSKKVFFSNKLFIQMKSEKTYFAIGLSEEEYSELSNDQKSIEKYSHKLYDEYNISIFRLIP